MEFIKQSAMRVLSIDPGKTSGWALHETDGQVSAGQLPHFDMIETAWTQIPRCNVVVCESFIITTSTVKKTQETWSLRQIGAFEWMARRLGVPFVLQSPASAKTFSTDDKLHKMGWWIKGQDHGRDALRHLLLYAVTNKLIDLARLL